MAEGPISTAGELVCDRVLEKGETGFVPGQRRARILDPRPRRDRADLAAVLTYVDDEGRACSVTCERKRESGEWRSIVLHRADFKHIEPSTAVGAPELEGELLEAVERAAADAEPFPYEPPSEEEQQWREMGRRLLDKVEADRA